MRVFKFRIWNNEEMIVLENSGVQYFDFEGNYSLGFTVDAYEGFWAHEQYETPTDKAKTFPIMQYTGIQDIKGIDIYEGDILETWVSSEWDNEVPHKERAVVEFDINKYWVKSLYTADWHELSYKWIVVGNIYQNPELLTKCNIK